jgi:hypothetical protein
MASEIQSKENAPPKATDDSAAVPRKEPAAEADPSMEHEEEPAVDDNAQDDVHEESDDDNGDEDDQSREPFTFDQIIQAIKEAAVLAEVSLTQNPPCKRANCRKPATILRIQHFLMYIFLMLDSLTTRRNISSSRPFMAFSTTA